MEWAKSEHYMEPWSGATPVLSRGGDAGQGGPGPPTQWNYKLYDELEIVCFSFLVILL